jgi:hypothetical protein
LGLAIGWGEVVSIVKKQSHYLWAIGIDPDKRRLTVYPMHGKDLIFHNKAEIDLFIESLVNQSRLWSQAPEQNREEVSFLDLGLTNVHKRSQLRRGLLFGKRRRRK